MFDASAIDRDHPLPKTRKSKENNCVCELDFADASAMEAAMGSPQGKSVVDDIKNYATGGAIPLNFEVKE